MAPLELESLPRDLLLGESKLRLLGKRTDSLVNVTPLVKGGRHRGAVQMMLPFL